MPERQHTILVVEDEAIIRFEVCQHLMECGYAVMEVDSAKDAIRLMVRHRDIDVLFTDVNLPGKSDGLDLARWALQQYPRMVVILTSGDQSKLRAIDDLCGLNALPKPYSPRVLSERLKTLLVPTNN